MQHNAQSVVTKVWLHYHKVENVIRVPVLYNGHSLRSIINMGS